MAKKEYTYTMSDEDKQVDLVLLARHLIKLDKADPTHTTAWRHMLKVAENVIKKINT